MTTRRAFLGTLAGLLAAPLATDSVPSGKTPAVPENGCYVAYDPDDPTADPRASQRPHINDLVA